MHDLERQHPELIEWLNQKNDLNAILAKADAQPELVPDLLDVIESDSGILRYPAEKVIRRLSEVAPERLIPYLPRMAALIRHPNHFIQWGFLLTLANLAIVDDQDFLKTLIPDYLELIHDPTMITAANAAKASVVLMLTYPEMTRDLLDRLIGVEQSVYLDKGEVSPECKNIMIGHVLDIFEIYGTRFGDPEALKAFALRHRHNPRLSVAKRAERYLKNTGS